MTVNGGYSVGFAKN